MNREFLYIDEYKYRVAVNLPLTVIYAAYCIIYIWTDLLVSQHLFYILAGCLLLTTCTCDIFVAYNPRCTRHGTWRLSDNTLTLSLGKKKHTMALSDIEEVYAKKYNYLTRCTYTIRIKTKKRTYKICTETGKRNAGFDQFSLYEMCQEVADAAPLRQISLLNGDKMPLWKNQ